MPRPGLRPTMPLLGPFNLNCPLRHLDDVELQAVTPRYDLEGHTIAIDAGSGQVATQPKTSMVEHLGTKHLDVADENIAELMPIAYA